MLNIQDIDKSFEVPRHRGDADSLDPRIESGRRRDRLWALRDVGFNVPPGQTLGLIGANGSGKTTLLKIIAGVMHPDRGVISADGRIGALLEVGAGFHHDLTGMENVQLSGALLGLGRREMDRHISEIIAFSELERMMDMPVKHFSSGMIVRLGFAIAIQLRPEILLLDETFAVGDARFQTRAFGKIRELQASGVTMILVSHTAELILELADRVVWLDAGKVADDGDPGDVLTRYRRQWGAHLAGADRLANRLIETSGELGEAEGKPAWITSAQLSSPAGDSPDTPETLELQLSDRLDIDVQIDSLADTDLKEYELEITFIRDDRRAVARSRTALSAPGPVRVTLDPIRLEQGEYETRARLIRRCSLPLGEPVHSFMVPQSLKILTPLPYDFRLVAKLPGRWA